MNRELILTLNPRMQFTRIAVYKMSTPVFLKKINHDPKDLEQYECYKDQTAYRTKIVMEELKANDIDVEDIKVIVGRGGLIKPVKSGVYEVNEALKRDLMNCEFGNDIVNIGGLIADGISKEIPGSRAFIAAPVVVDEFEDVARFTGRPELKRRSIFHALNQKTVARKYAKSIYKKYEELNLIVAHLGGGFSVGAHKKGRVVDANQAYDGDGPFSPIRSGSLPMGDVIRMCYSGKYTQGQMLNMQTGQGGLFAYFKTYSGYDVCQMRDAGDEKAARVLEAMAYQVAKEIGSMYAVLGAEEIDAILITGGMAKDEEFVRQIKERVQKMAAIAVFPGSDDLGSLGVYGKMVLRNEIDVLEYK
jgi:butyrate kinase